MGVSIRPARALPPPDWSPPHDALAKAQHTSQPRPGPPAQIHDIGSRDAAQQAVQYARNNQSRAQASDGWAKHAACGQAHNVAVACAQRFALSPLATWVRRIDCAFVGWNLEDVARVEHFRGD